VENTILAKLLHVTELALLAISVIYAMQVKKYDKTSSEFFRPSDIS
jgi:hypothetical protein